MMRTTTTLLLAIVLLASCNQYKKTPTGLAYKITKGDGKVKLKQGDFVKFNIEFKIAPKDSVLSSSYGKIPAYMVIDTSRSPKHSFLEVITQLSAGDKMEFVMNVDTLKKMGMLEYNNMFHARDMIKGRLEILKTFANQADVIADRTKEIEQEKTKELKAVNDFVAKKGIKTQATRSGALVEIQTAGDMTQKADSGKMAKVMYKGMILETGKEFDSNMGTPGKAPLMVSVGVGGTQNSVIQGLDEALQMFGKGGKGKVYIPAMLGYGDAGSPPVIPTYANLQFEFEVLDVTLPAPSAPAPAMPNAPQPKKK
ncbi:MAG: FKBP-type peptidyl-prolyl cis-trans isomerase [Bacteroidota bacterium]